MGQRAVELGAIEVFPRVFFWGGGGRGAEWGRYRPKPRISATLERGLRAAFYPESPRIPRYDLEPTTAILTKGHWGRRARKDSKEAETC